MADSTQRSALLPALALAVLYFALGKLCFHLTVSFDSVTSVVFVPEGLALAFLVLYGPKVAPAIVVGQTALAVSVGVPLPYALLSGTTNAAADLLGVYLLKRLAIGAQFQHPRDVLLFVGIVTVVVQPLSATFGVLAAWLAGHASTERVGDAWLYWWTGNTMGQLLVTPLVLTHASLPREASVLDRWRERAAITLLLGVMTLLLFGAGRGSSLSHPLFLFAAFYPLLTWVAVRFGPREVTLFNVAAVAIAVWATVRGLGPFAGRSPSDSVVYLSTFVAGATNTALLIAALFEERRALVDELRIFHLAIAHSPLGYEIADLDGAIEYVNPTYLRMTGLSAGEIAEARPSILEQGNIPAELHEELWATVTSGRTFRHEIRSKRKSGDEYWEDVVVAPVFTEQGALGHFVSIRRDVSAEKAHQEELTRQATVDMLSGLANRRHFLERAQAELLRARRFDHPTGLLMLDLDDFKRVNDTLGHAVGDRVIQGMSRVLMQTIRGVDLGGRLGGEEFAVLLPETDAEGTTQVADRLREAIDLASVSAADGARVRFTASIGATVIPPGEERLEPALDRADEALYEAKRAGKNCVRVR